MALDLLKIRPMEEDAAFPPGVRIFLNKNTVGGRGDYLLLSPFCMDRSELDAHVDLIKENLDRIREEAYRFFDEAAASAGYNK
ncbi:MAG: hypothetical protein HZA20_07595 [Nitrospirae bacterium]|jgi:hypothetical protein|nr:hypothetical protein [Nitrospirota bacterium]